MVHQGKKKRVKEKFIAKISRGPFAAILSKGPLKDWAAETLHDAETKKQDALKEIDYNFHKLTHQELEQELKTSCAHGLNEEQAKAVLLKNGPNMLKPPETHYIRKILGYLFGGFCWLLWICSIVMFICYALQPVATNLGFYL